MEQERKQLYEHIFKPKYNPNRTHSYYIKNNFPLIYEKLTNNLNIYEQQFKQKLYDFLFDVKETPKCKHIFCHNNVPFYKISKGYALYCCKKCKYDALAIDSNFKEKISINKKINENNKLRDKYNYNFINDKVYLENYCEHDSIISKNEFYYLNDRNAQTLCPICNNFYLNEWIPSEEEKEEQYDFFKSLISKSTLNITEKRIKKLYPKMYRCMHLFPNKQLSSWEEYVYCYKNQIKQKPICKNCLENECHFHNPSKAYSLHCRECCDNKEFVLEKINSQKEKDVLQFIKDNYDGEVIHGKYFKKFQIDIYLPEFNIGIEFNGLYWHSDKVNKNNYYHFDKYMFFKEKGIQIINIWEDDWDNKKEIVKSLLINKLKQNKTKIYARQTVIREISYNDAKKFCGENHIQGASTASIRLGLFYNGELVSLMTFGKLRMITHSNKVEDSYELIRFCNKKYVSVVGAASKLLNYFKKTYNYNSIVSYANLDISNGGLYELLGFKFVKHTGVNFWWVKNGVKYHRSKFMKFMLVEKGYDKNKKADDIMKELGYNKLWGVGNLKYEMSK